VFKKHVETKTPWVEAHGVFIKLALTSSGLHPLIIIIERNTERRADNHRAPAPSVSLIIFIMFIIMKKFSLSRVKFFSNTNTTSIPSSELHACPVPRRGAGSFFVSISNPRAECRVHIMVVWALIGIGTTFGFLPDKMMPWSNFCQFQTGLNF
jgi:hypothetical protein